MEGKRKASTEGTADHEEENKSKVDEGARLYATLKKLLLSTIVTQELCFSFARALYVPSIYVASGLSERFWESLSEQGHLQADQKSGFSISQNLVTFVSESFSANVALQDAVSKFASFCGAPLRTIPEPRDNVPSSIADLLAKARLLTEIDKSMSLDAIWRHTDEQYILLNRLLEHFAKETQSALETKHYNKDLIERLRPHLDVLAESFVVLRRQAYFKSYIQYNLKPCQVFLSHAGEQKASYVSWMNDLMQENAQVFFDERSLKGGDDPTDAMLHAALTCKIGLVVVTKEFLKKSWPLLELTLFAARLRIKERLGRRSIERHMADEEVIDATFNLLPDFYGSGPFDIRWVDDLENFPSLLFWPTGYRREQRLDPDHVRLIMKDCIAILQTPGLTGVLQGNVSKVAKWLALYGTFKLKRNQYFAQIFPQRANGETTASFCIRALPLVAPQRYSNSPLDQVAEQARAAGRECIAFAFYEGASIISEHEQYMLQQGYAELTNVWLVTASLDALNWKIMNPTEFNGTVVNSWGVVCMILEKPKDLCCKFIPLYQQVQADFAAGKLKEDPYPSNDMKYVMKELQQGKS